MMPRNTNNSASARLPAAENSAMNTTPHHITPTSGHLPQKLKRILPSTDTPHHGSSSSSVLLSTTRSTEENVAGPPRRGRRPNGSTHVLSRTAREAARKTNHSRIEKLRREKINDALAALRNLVPVVIPSGAGDDADDTNDSTRSQELILEKDEREKSFKLDILERTVAYVTHLQQRLEDMESSRQHEGDLNAQENSGDKEAAMRCCTCKGLKISTSDASPSTANSSSLPKSLSTKRSSMDLNAIMAVDVEMETRTQIVAKSQSPPSRPPDPPETTPSSSSISTAAEPHISNRLSNSPPSLKKLAASTAVASPMTLPPISMLLGHGDFVPPISPPSSGRSKPVVSSLNAPPNLNLPKAHRPSYPIGQGRTLDTLRETGAEGDQAPSMIGGSRSEEGNDEIRSNWSVEEENAASLLVQFSAEPPVAAKEGNHRAQRSIGQTPSSLLGLLNPAPVREKDTGQPIDGARKRARMD